MKILYLGTMDWGTTSLQRYEALRSAAKHAYSVDLRIFQGEYLKRSPWMRLQIRLGHGLFIRRIASDIVLEAIRYRPDVFWVDQGVCVGGDALRRVKEKTGAILVHYTPDSLKAMGFNNACFSRAVKEYDLCITTKPDESEHYRKLGARRVIISCLGYDPHIHRPLCLCPAEREKYECDVSFIGQRMSARAKSLSLLIDKVPCKLNLYGRQWEKGDTGAKLAPYQKGWLSGDEYSKAINGAKICLAFLNREVSDNYTSRSIEIPACGAFMLAERTEAHSALFKEGEEAAFFGDDEEMIDRVRYYITHDVERQRIARAGHERVNNLGLSWDNLMKECMVVCEKLKSNKLYNPPQRLVF